MLLTDFEFDDPLPHDLSNFLIALVQHAKEMSAIEVSFSTTPSPAIPSAYNYHLVGTPDIDHRVITDLRGKPLRSLAVLGLVEFIGDNHILLYPNAFSRAKYEQKSKMGKFFFRIWRKGRDIILGISFGLSLFLTILKILEIAFE